MSLTQCSIIITYSAHLLYLFHNPGVNLTGKTYYSLTICLLALGSLALILLLIVVFFQIKFICTNETTSENIRSQPKMFDIGCCKNIKEFFNDNLAYRSRVNYSPAALGYLKTFKKITEYLSLVERRSLISSISKMVKNRSIENTTGLEENETEFDITRVSNVSSNVSGANQMVEEK